MVRYGWSKGHHFQDCFLVLLLSCTIVLCASFAVKRTKFGCLGCCRLFEMFICSNSIEVLNAAGVVIFNVCTSVIKLTKLVEIYA